MKKTIRFVILFEAILLVLFAVTYQVPSLWGLNLGIRYLHIVGLAAWAFLESMVGQRLSPFGALFVVVPIQILVWLLVVWMVGSFRNTPANQRIQD